MDCRRPVLFAIIFVLLARALSAIARGDTIQFTDSMDVKPDEHIQADLQVSNESYYIYKPGNYTGSEPFGLIVYIDPANNVQNIPEGWARVLERRKLLFISPQNAGNDQLGNRRMGLAVAGAFAVQKHFKIDPTRIYAAGYSGGARVASELGFYASDVFYGTIQSCGSDFIRAVPQVQAKPLPEDAGTIYGITQANPDEIAAAKKNVRFVLITGSKDFRHGNLVDIFSGGFEKDSFAAKLIDVPLMAHVPCGPATLNEAIDFIEQIPSAPDAETASRAAPSWMALDPSKWPQILLINDAKLEGNVQFDGASGFLTRLPNGLVVGATAKHLLGKDVPLGDFSATVKSWAMHPPLQPGKRVKFAKLAEKLPDGDAIDCLVMAPTSQTDAWPVDPPAMCADKLEESDTVYLLAVPYGDKSSQNVYKGTVTSVEPSGVFYYQLPQKPNSRGFSGAPIIDTRGRIIGMHTGHAEQAGLYSGLEMKAVLNVIQFPAELLPATRKSVQARTPATDPVKSGLPPDSPEIQAETALQRVKIYMDNKAYGIAKEKLGQIIVTYPHTTAAAKAQQMLNGLENP